MDSTRPSLSVLKRDFGIDFAIDAIVDLIVSAQEFFNVTVKMSPTQITETADIILERYYFLKIAELKLCFRNAKAGDYGEIYNRIDGSVVMGWLAKYDQARNQAIIKANKSMQAELDGIHEVWQNEDVIKALRMTVDKLSTKDQPVEHLRIRELSREEKLIQQWMSEFDDIYNSTTDDKSNPTRMIFYEGGWMDQSDYLKLKHVEYQESN